MYFCRGSSFFKSTFLVSNSHEKIFARMRGWEASKKVKLGNFPKPLRPKPIGIDILHDSLWNKGTAFPIEERDTLGLRGLLPPCVREIDYQVNCALRYFLLLLIL